MASRYTILLDRTAEEDDQSAHGGAAGGRRQVAAELCEAIDASGLPVGVFQVAAREEIPDELVGDFGETLLERAERHLRVAREALQLARRQHPAESGGELEEAFQAADQALDTLVMTTDEPERPRED
jgi:hypothetical protein